MASEIGELAFLPLGGTGEIGMNFNLYRWRAAGNEKFLAVDCGIGFGGSELPEVEVMMADPGYIADRKDKLVGLVITHAHEDHIGAVAWLWPRLKCPVYCTPFAAHRYRPAAVGDRPFHRPCHAIRHVLGLYWPDRGPADTDQD